MDALQADHGRMILSPERGTFFAPGEREVLSGFTGVPLLRCRRNCRSAGIRPRKLHIPRPAASGRSRPLRCSSSPNSKRCAGLLFGPIPVLPEKVCKKEALDAFYSAYARKGVSLHFACILPLSIDRTPSGRP